MDIQFTPQLFGLGLFVVLVSAIGAVIARFARPRSGYAFGIDVVLAVSAIILMFAVADFVHEAEEFISMGEFLGVGALAFLGYALLVRLMPEAHCHHGDDEHAASHAHGRRGARGVLIGDAVHNIADGFALAIAFSAGELAGIAAFIGIALHEAVQEVAEFAVLKRAGYSTARALVLNGLVACTIFVGMALATGIGSVIPESFAGYMFAIAAGVMLHVVAFDVVPHVRKKAAYSH